MQNEAIEVGKYNLLDNPPIKILTYCSTAGHGAIHYREGGSETCLVHFGDVAVVHNLTHLQDIAQFIKKEVSRSRLHVV